MVKNGFTGVISRVVEMFQIPGSFVSVFTEYDMPVSSDHYRPVTVGAVYRDPATLSGDRVSLCAGDRRGYPPPRR